MRGTGSCPCSKPWDLQFHCRKCGNPLTLDDRSSCSSTTKPTRAKALAFFKTLDPLIKDLFAMFDKPADSGGSGENCEEVNGALARVQESFGRACESLLSEQLKRAAGQQQRREMASYRAKVIEELLTSEYDYLNDLQILEKIWHSEVAKSGLLSASDAQVLFGGLPQLTFLSSELVGALMKAKEARPEEQMVGEAFGARIPFFKVYIEWTLNQVQSSNVLETQLRREKFRELLERIRSGNSVVRQLDLQAFLIKPTQRVVKYPLLLRELREHTDAEHADYANLTAAIDGMKKVLTEINERKSERETVLLLSTLQPSLVWQTRAAEPIDLMQSHSRIIKQAKIKCSLDNTSGSGSGAVTTQEKGTHAFLFNTVFLVCRAGGKGDKEHHVELASPLVQDITAREAPGQAVVVVDAKTQRDWITMWPETPVEQQLWVSSINEAAKDPPITPLRHLSGQQGVGSPLSTSGGTSSGNQTGHRRESSKAMRAPLALDSDSGSASGTPREQLKKPSPIRTSGPAIALPDLQEDVPATAAGDEGDGVSADHADDTGQESPADTGSKEKLPQLLGGGHHRSSAGGLLSKVSAFVKKSPRERDRRQDLTPTPPLPPYAAAGPVEPLLSPRSLSVRSMTSPKLAEEVANMHMLAVPPSANTNSKERSTSQGALMTPSMAPAEDSSPKTVKSPSPRTSVPPPVPSAPKPVRP